MMRTASGRTGEGAPRRTAGDGLSLHSEIVKIANFVPKILFQGERHRLDHAGERTRAKTRGHGHTQNAPQRAATIDCIHWLSPFFVFFFDSSRRGHVS
jgi:hypothetical protein